MQSMTGFGDAFQHYDEVDINVEMKSLNNRYLEISCSLPPQLDRYQIEMEKRIKSAVKRGKINITVTAQTPSTEGGRLFDEELAIRYCSAARRLADRCELDRTLSLDTLITIIGLHTDAPQIPSESLWQKTKAPFCAAMQQLRKTRMEEGERLAVSLREMAGGLERDARRAQQLSEGAAKDQRLRLERRLESFTDVKIERERLMKEVAIQLCHYDIEEEICRLRSHLTALKDLLTEQTEPVGKQLDFIFQELNREANTLCSKSMSAEIQMIGVAMKNRVESMREQVRNVE